MFISFPAQTIGIGHFALTLPVAKQHGFATSPRVDGCHGRDMPFLHHQDQISILAKYTCQLARRVPLKREPMQLCHLARDLVGWLVHQGTDPSRTHLTAG
ncbi:hypothetical protein U876_07080 [Aeromonas hydrophila NJ-35]|nr:hypothetical protein V469_07105 [Aeromonas hydrophila J-1]AKJ37004.1 hypothetical protein U876_07080 [Aeromonas hydrophila NJ-35]ANR99396.1 hypothetical protein A9258_07085 [Aeromonas hydrophila]